MDNFNPSDHNSSTPQPEKSEVTTREDMRISTNGINGNIVIRNTNGHVEGLPTRRKGPLSEAHIKELEASGIAADTARVLGIRTVTGPELARYGWEGPILNDPSEYLLYPYLDPWGNPQTWENAEGEEFPFARAKKPVDKQQDGGKYTQPKNSGQHLYIPSRLDKNYWKVLGETEDGDELSFPEQQDIRVTEGEKKAICSYVHTGVLTLGMGGVNNYRAPYLFEYFMASRTLQFCFDNDIWTNHKIEKAMNAAGKWLIELAISIADIALQKKKEDIDRAKRKVEENLPHVDGLKKLRQMTLPKLTGGAEALVYTLLPLHPQDKKLGIDDWLIGEEAKESPLARNILDTKIPLYFHGAKARVNKLWQNSDQKRDLKAFLGGTIKNLTMGGVDKEPSRDLCAMLVCATASMGSATLSHDIPHIWGEKQTWDPITKEALHAHLSQIRTRYGFPDGCNGIGRLIPSTFNTWNRHDLPESVDYVGLKSQDLNMHTGELTAISQEHSVRLRSDYDLIKGTPRLWLRAVEELFGPEQIDVFRAMLRLSFAPWGYTEDFLPVVVGEPGCGKSSLFRAIAAVLPRVVGSNGAIDHLQSRNANAGYFPYGWANSHMVIDYDHKSKRALEPETLALINAASENGGRAGFRLMGRDALELPVTFRIWILANSLPKISSLESGGFKRRLVFLECKSSERKGNEQDPLWVKKIVELEAGQILNWVFSLSVEEARLMLKAAKEGGSIEKHREQLTLEEHEDIAVWLEELEHTLWKYKNGKIRSEYEIGELDELFSLSRVEWPAGIEFDNTTPVDSSTGHAHYTAWCKKMGYVRRSQKNWITGLERLGAKVFRVSNGIKRIRTRGGERVRPVGLPLDIG